MIRKAVISVYLDPDLKAKFEAICKAETLTMSTYIVRMIQEAVDREHI
ncbi:MULTISPECIES: ribbon-helix-helix protein, CopG family [unclassified Microcoleus]